MNMCKDLKLEEHFKFMEIQDCVSVPWNRGFFFLWLLPECHLQASSPAGLAASGLIFLYWLLCRLLAVKPSYASPGGLALTL